MTEGKRAKTLLQSKDFVVSPTDEFHCRNCLAEITKGDPLSDAPIWLRNIYGGSRNSSRVEEAVIN